MPNIKLTTDEALELLVELIRYLFKDNIVQLKQESIKRRFEKDLFDILGMLKERPYQKINQQPIWIQRLVYEMLGQYVMFYSLQPNQLLNVELIEGMTQNDKISALFAVEIIPNSWPYPESVPF
ncbi:MAG: hypothetical protein KZQ64_15220 [gamma proteobacterium symbiont of Bathyaustriella thionipta]|nr:hypothetical protein [gamma proteobacterium symbiont of Bathyaustriella thionipta]MCU7950663.1 hypothetical protein [gamma proteobacterium symbiont of Bathyaustriella thionipta]MCU7954720.1 hypothetical protein [gamma proteobacterium symbiont of Bathyaustriella thionipta]MCU7957166.1 hypothetical protein [gamma proteobacterium symbiont of Bathyaustriella thionipta]MCU7966339.1 hypothetical protein [gamma proteobacterium symbiont of Bathyaustriella thionipta]